ncbi:c-type cytochrome [Maribacter sp. 2210JD10-5]|uniref:DUF7133 domain-containing protein n=1 Tax=Maribacter sp. 2210JD10-5 TaxID=3386272 RepID=UPI0039BD197A
MEKHISLILILLSFVGCKEEIIKQPRNLTVDEITDDEEIKSFMNSFNSMGIQTDGSLNMPAEESLKKFKIEEDLAIDLVLSEPIIHQPVDISFDHRGRLWVVQYNQYPYPEGVKVVDLDRHNRAIFDKELKPPTEGELGADKITFFEDTNGDGTFDKSTDAITGLNITTGVVLGRNKIWVLTPPYLVAYPDPDGDGLPNGKPEVHLEGFGLEDTHAVANNLRWGPDGWLYGAQGSTCIANVSSKNSKNVYLSGQGIWRYHPAHKIFEIFAEGGGNTFDVEFDKKGRVYSGDNGTSRGLYYKQGGYYIKNWGKHGPLRNPYAFGFLPGMELVGEKFRFTHAWIKYEEENLPERYQGKILALNPLHNFVRLTRVVPKGSTFLCIDEEKVLQSEDHWFRPVDIKSGPDGAVYLADWNDSRMSHVDPRDTWSKTTGRIYRIRNKEGLPTKSFDLSKLNDDELITLLRDKNKWFRQEALRQFGDKKNTSIVPKLVKLLEQTTNGQLALEALWAINLSGGFTDEIAIMALEHTDPYVRSWGIRLVGDTNESSKKVALKLIDRAGNEKHLEVLGQLASTAKRLPAATGIPIIKNLLKNTSNQEDIENQLFTWWAIEAHVEKGREELLALFKDKDLWNTKLVKEVILSRLVQRYAIKGTFEDYKSCLKLLQMTPSDMHSKIALTGLQEGLRGRNLLEVPTDIVKVMEELQSKFGAGRLTSALRKNESEAVKEVLDLLPNTNVDKLERLSYIKVFGEIDQPQAIPVLLKIAKDHKYSTALREASLKALNHYDNDEIGAELAESYPFKLRADLGLRNASFRLFASRATWAHDFLYRITETRQVKKEEVPLDIVRQFKLLGDSTLTKKVETIWPDVKLVTSEEKQIEIQRIANALSNGKGDIANGKTVYKNFCASCHVFKEQGGDIGPDLTGYDRSNLTYMVLNIVNPNADIREGYVNYKIEKNDGQIFVGILRNRTAESIAIQPLGSDEIILATSEIKNIAAQSNSIMPERLSEDWSEQEIRDLFAYIQS